MIIGTKIPVNHSDFLSVYAEAIIVLNLGLNLCVGFKRTLAYASASVAIHIIQLFV